VSSHGLANNEPQSGEASLDSLQHSSDVRNSEEISNGVNHTGTISEFNILPPITNSRTNPSVGFHFLSTMNMQNPVEVSENAAMGETGTFRSKAMARRWVNTSRRKLLEKDASTKSLSSTSSSRETTPLIVVADIPEDRSASNPESMEEAKAETNIWSNFLNVWIGKYVSIFLLATPLAIWATLHGWSGTWIFWTNFVVLLPLASILGDFTEEAALHTNETIGGLLNATFGNSVEVIVALQALLKDEIRVVQASMIGSIFSNLLLVLGSCFLFGGIFYREQTFNVTSANASMGLLALSSLALVLPTPYAKYYEVQDEDVLIISRAAAIGLFVMYLQLLLFQLHTHRHVFDETAAPTEGADGNADDKEDELPTIPMWMAFLGLGVVTSLVALFSDALVGSIDDYCEETRVSRTFVGLIILPIVGNAVEHITAVNVGK
jgi:Ca2+:H+ antiporter